MKGNLNTFYDTKNNFIWSISPNVSLYKVNCWINTGTKNNPYSLYSPNGLPAIDINGVSDPDVFLANPDYNMPSSFEEKVPVSLEKASIILLYHLDIFTRRLLNKVKLSNSSPTLQAEKQQQQSVQSTLSSPVQMNEHFCLQVAKDVFAELHSLLSLCFDNYKSRTHSIMFKYAILVTLRVLKLNLNNLLLSRLPLRDYGLEDGVLSHFFLFQSKEFRFNFFNL